jgi:hypothetical protein
MALTKCGDDVAFGVTIEPSSVVIKVGDKSEIKVAVTNPEQVSGREVCFSLEGFPTSGFRTTFTPECADSQSGNVGTVLTVEATPAAAPQNVTAYVIASSGNRTAQTVLNITVVPAMPAWIPWAGLLVFFSILGIAIFLKPRIPRKGNRRIASSKGNTARQAKS